MAARTIALPLALVVCAVAASAGATQFKVGGQSGWSVPGATSEPYNTWAGRLRFQIGDELLFVYPKETDSVLLVADAAAYNACNTSSYVARFDDGSTVFTFHRSGPFFFVSGNEASCRANQKLIVIVLADRTRTPPAAPPPMSAAPPLPSPPGSPHAAAPAPVPATSSPPPSSSGAAPVPAPAATPTSPPSPPASASAPAPAPTTTTPSSPPAPASQTPSPSTTPTPGGGSSPSTTPTPGGGSSSPPSASANVPAGGSTTPPTPSASAPVVAGFVGSLGAFIGYAMLAA